MLPIFLALLALVASPQPERHLDVTFVRSITSVDAHRLLREVAPEAEVVSDAFEPVTMNAGMAAPPSEAQMAALFEGGAVSVQTLRLDAQLAAFGVNVEPNSHVARSAVVQPYTVIVEVPGFWTSDQARALFASALGLRSSQRHQDRKRGPPHGRLWRGRGHPPEAGGAARGRGRARGVGVAGLWRRPQG